MMVVTNSLLMSLYGVLVYGGFPLHSWLVWTLPRTVNGMTPIPNLTFSI